MITLHVVVILCVSVCVCVYEYILYCPIFYSILLYYIPLYTACYN